MTNKFKYRIRAAQLSSMIGMAFGCGAAFAADCSSATVAAGQTVSGNCSMPPGVVFTIEQGATLTATDQTTLNNTYTGSQAPSFLNNGTLGSYNSPNTGTVAFYNSGDIISFTNNGLITAPSYYVIGNQGTIATFTNTGTISGANGFLNDGSIGTLTNTGTISELILQSMFHSTTLSTLNNLQGAGNNAGALVVSQGLPANYNIIINSPTHYGQLSATNVFRGTMNFGISPLSSSGSSVLGTYTSVLSGITPTQLGLSGSFTSGTSNGYTYTLQETSSISNIWDLILLGAPILGPSAADTNTSTAALASSLATPFALQSAELNNNLNNDCSSFDAHGVCVGAAGRYTVIGNNGPTDSAAVVYGGFRVNRHVRVGAWADQGVSAQTKTAAVSYGTTNPMVGVYGVWAQHPDEQGLSVRVAAGYGDQNLTLSRAVTGSSEAGSGSTNFNVQGTSAEVSYAHFLPHGWVASPYAGLRYSKATLGGYTEQTSSSVTDPLTYGALSTETTTALAGVRFAGHLSSKIMANASIGVEQDLANAGGAVSVTNSSIGTLNAMTVNITVNRTRPTASLGASYALGRAQQIGLSVGYGSQPFSSTGVSTAQVQYTAGF